MQQSDMQGAVEAGGRVFSISPRNYQVARETDGEGCASTSAALTTAKGNPMMRKRS